MLKLTIVAIFLETGIAFASHYSGHRYGHNYEYRHVVRAPVISRHHVTYRLMPSYYETPKSTTIEMDTEQIPVNFVFRSASGSINIKQIHEGATGSYKESHSYDAPHIIKHYVTKPIHQIVHEVIVPYRRIVQQIEPVNENIQTVVAKQRHHNPVPEPVPTVESPAPEPSPEPMPEPNTKQLHAHHAD